MTQPLPYDGTPTDYSPYRVPQLWQMVEGEDGTLAGHQELAWKRQEQLLNNQAGRLRKLRDELANKWPPEKSDAAAVFVAHIDSMIAAMKETSIAVAELKTGLSQISGALSDARAELEPLIQRYSDPSMAWKSFNDQMLPGLPDHLVPDRSIPGLDTFEPMIVRAHQRSLDEQAREILQASDSKVLESRAKLVELPRYGKIGAREVWDPGIGTAPTRSGSNGSDAFSGSQSTTIPAPTFTPPMPAIISDSVQDNAGPILAGGPEQFAPAAGSPPQGAGGSTVLPIGGSQGGTTPGAIGGIIPGTVVPGAARGGQPAQGAAGRQGTRAGGVIAPIVGGQPGGPPRGTPSRPSGPTPGVIGGHIGGGSRGGSIGATGVARDSSRPNTGRPTITVTGLDNVRGAPVVGGYRDRSYEDYTNRERVEGDADNPWSVDEGVTPVLRPSTKEVRHDPGPGVIGIDL